MTVDLDRARESAAGFASEALGVELTPAQRDATDWRTLVTAIVAPRQSGKSFALAVGAAWWAARRRDQRVLIVSGGETSAQRMLRIVRDLAERSPLASSVTSESAWEVRMSNGSSVEVATTSERRIRGASVDLLLFDEAGLLPPEIVQAAEPTVAAREGGRIVLAGTPWREGSPFHRYVQAAERGSPTVRLVQWAVEDAPFMNSELVEHHRATMTPSAFAAEYEGRWADDDEALFSRSLLDAATADYRRCPLAELPPGVKVWGGLDWGRRHDRSALTAWGIVVVGEEEPRLALAPAALHVWPRGTTTTQTVRDVLASTADWQVLTAESNGIGAGPCDMLAEGIAECGAVQAWQRSGGARPPRPTSGLRLSPGERLALHQQGIRVVNGGSAFAMPPDPNAPERPAPLLNPHATSAGSKAAALGALRSLLERGDAVLPREPELLRQLSGLRVELRPSGAEKIENDPGVSRHDDLADSAWLGLAPHPRWPTKQAAVHALAAYREAWSGLPAPEGELVRTGAGVALGRDPLWLSPATAFVDGWRGQRLTGGGGSVQSDRLAGLRAAIKEKAA